jgi:hypothetical protein
LFKFLSNASLLVAKATSICFWIWLQFKRSQGSLAIFIN